MAGATTTASDLASLYGIDINAAGPGGATSFNPSQNHSFTDPFIYLGQDKITESSNATAAESIIASGGSVKGGKLSDLQRAFIKSSQENQRHWAYMLALAGYGDATLAADPKKAAEWAMTAPLSDVLNMHYKFLSDAADQFNLYKRKVTPTGLMKQMLSFRLGKNFNGNLNSVTPDKVTSLTPSLAGTTTATQKSIDFMNPEDAKAMVRNTLQQQLGRDPTQAEYEDFLATIHAAERANPTTQTTTTTTDAQGNPTNQTSTTHGGLTNDGYNQLLYEKAKSMPSWAVWQAVGTYAPALFGALDAPVSGV